MTQLSLTHSRAALISACCFLLTTSAACALDPADQVGPHPELPPIQQYLFPPMHLAKVVGWGEGEKPSVAPGLSIERFAAGLQHPRLTLRATKRRRFGRRI